MKFSHVLTCSTLSSFASLAAADWQFRSRPELSIPKLNITVPANRQAVGAGLIFVAPYEGFEDGHKGPIQPGAYIYRDDGELVWSGVGYHAGWVANFRPDIWNGEPHLRAFQGRLDRFHGRMYGFHTLLGSDYQVEKVVTVGSHRLVSAHEFRIVGGKTALIETPIPRTASLKQWGGSDEQNWIVSGGFQEIDIETGEVLFEWESLNHVDPKYSAFPLDFGEGLPGSGRNDTDAWNYFHINSVDKDDEGNYLISARNVAALFKINGTNGDVIWQLGGLSGGSSVSISRDDRFAYQHDARFLNRSRDGTIETLSLFDNGAHSASVKTHPFSRARIIQIDHTTGTAKALQTFDAPDELSAHTQGNAQTLPNGNVFVNWGQAGAVTEFSPEGEVLFHSYLDSEPISSLVQSYRGFRYEWKGTPVEEPAVVIINADKRPGLDIYVSWNGDTETRSWRFYGGSEEGSQPILLGEVQRSGFETHAGLIEAPEGLVFVSAEALGSSGEVLRRSRAVRISSDDVHASRPSSFDLLADRIEEL